MTFDNMFARWRFGANFIPSTAINQLEMWQEDTFDPVTIERELGWAAAIGMSVMRVYLHDLLHLQDAAGLKKRMEHYLSIADKFHIKTMFVFFDDCWKSDFALGKQPDPVPKQHNSGWIQSPGSRVGDDISQWGRLEEYVLDIMTHFAHDPRIIAWDLYNEPGNGSAGDHETITGFRGKVSLPLVNAVFDWAEQAKTDQPYTIGLWSLYPDFYELNRVQIERSQIITFHCYAPRAGFEERLKFMQYLADGRPVVCTEYLARGKNCTFEDCLPMMKEHNVMAINWGLVAGKTNTIYPWNWNADSGEPEKYFHDVFYNDGRLLYESERTVFEQVCIN